MFKTSTRKSLSGQRRLTKKCWFRPFFFLVHGCNSYYILQCFHSRYYERLIDDLLWDYSRKWEFEVLSSFYRIASPWYERCSVFLLLCAKLYLNVANDRSLSIIYFSLSESLWNSGKLNKSSSYLFLNVYAIVFLVLASCATQCSWPWVLGFFFNKIIL